MKPGKLDVIRLKDGKEVTILEVFGEGDAFYVEYDLPDQDDCELFSITPDQIEEITWRAP